MRRQRPPQRFYGWRCWAVGAWYDEGDMNGSILLSVLISIAIIGVLFLAMNRTGNITSPGGEGVFDLTGLDPLGAARDTQRISHLKQYQTGLELYFTEMGGYPSTAGERVDVVPDGEPCVTLITFDYQGQVTEVFDLNGVLDGSVVIGTQFYGSIMFESTWPDSTTGSDRGEYAWRDTDIDAGFFFSQTFVGNYGWEVSILTPDPFGAIIVHNNRPAAWDALS